MRGADVMVTFAMLDMEMGNQEYRLTEIEPGVYSQGLAGARDGRPLGARVPGDAEARRAGQRARRRPGGRMSGNLATAWLRLAAGAAALAAGAASAVVAILLVQRVLA